MSMVMEYGSRRRPRSLFVPALAAAVAVGAAIFIGVSVYDSQQARAANIAQAKAYAVTGPPCPGLAPNAPADPTFQAWQVSEFRGLSFTRAHGDVQCADIFDDGGRGATDHPVCQFSHPGVLKLQAAGRSVAWNIPVLRPATVAVVDGKPSCVLGATKADFQFKPGMGRL